MGEKNGFDRIKEERKSLSFFKIFQSADLFSESMRAIPYNFMKRIPEKDFSYKMVIKARWGSSWEVEISKNPRFYYMEKLGWNQFVKDNALGENEFVTFTLKGKMCFTVNIYEQHGKELAIPRKPPSMASTRRSRKEQAENIVKDAKKEEETFESMGGIEVEVKKKENVESETSKKKKKKKKKKSKKVVNDVETGESTGEVELKARKKKAEESKKKKIKSKKVVNDVRKKKAEKKKIKSKVVNGIPEFTITIKKSYLKFLAIPKDFGDEHIPNKSKMFTIHHPNGNDPWKVLCLVREIRTIFSRGWSKMAREFPLLVGDSVTFKLIEPTEFILVVSKEAKEEIITP